MSILPKLNELYISFNEICKSNPVVAGLIGLYGLGMFTFLFRNVPSTIFGFIKREITTTLVLNSDDDIYFDFLKWVSINKNHSFVRNFNITGKQKTYSGDSNIDTSVLAIGYGRIYFTFKRHLFYMDRIKVEANNTAQRKEVITLNVYGRNKKIFEFLFEEIKNFEDKTSELIQIYAYDHDWFKLGKVQKRKIETVTIPKKQKENLLNHLDIFISEKKWYIDNAIPWNTGILLSGPPGTGKTSLIKAICSHYSKPLYLITLSKMDDESLREALGKAEDSCVIAIEDIDVAGVSVSRSEEIKSLTDPKENLSLSGLLNAIDGLASGEGRILIATTNNIDALDKALVREGRFDLKLVINYMSNDTYLEYMKRFYPDFNFDGYEVLANITPAFVQSLVFKNRKDPLPVLEKSAKK